MRQRIVIFSILAAMSALVQAQVRYRVTDLSELAAGSEIIPSVGYCINDQGDVAGHGMPAAEGSTSKPFLYQAAAGAFINLGNLAGDFFDGHGGNGYGINNAGQVVGRNSMTSTNWNYRPFLFTDRNHNSVVDPNEMVNLTFEPAYNYGWADAINNAGQVVGFSRDVNDDFSGWVWTDTNGNGTPEAGEIQYFAGYFPNSINDHGDLALSKGVNSYLWSDVNSNGIYEADELQEMPMPGGYFDEGIQYSVTIHELSPVTINNSGALCGAAENYFGKANGFYWQDGNGDGRVDPDEYVLFGSALKQTHVRAMNNRAQVVGGTYEYVYTPFPGHSNRSAFIWTPSEGMVNLNDAADADAGGIGPRWFSQAEGINDQGQIVTSGWYDVNGDGKRTTADPERVFVLTPYLTGDINEDKKVDLSDFEIISRYYNAPATNYPGADIDGSGHIDLGDVVMMIEDWTIHLN